MVTKIVVLFNLQADADVSAYEKWARETDLPIVNKLGSVEKFEVFRTTGTLAGDASPYQYIEVLDVSSVDALLADAGSDLMQKVAAEFQAFADNPTFILTENLA